MEHPHFPILLMPCLRSKLNQTALRFKLWEGEGEQKKLWSMAWIKKTTTNKAQKKKRKKKSKNMDSFDDMLNGNVRAGRINSAFDICFSPLFCSLYCQYDTL